MHSLVQKITGDYIRNESGSIAIIAAIVIFTLVIAVGLAMDYSRQVSTKAQLQSSLDAGLLSAAHTLKKTSNASEIKREVERQVRRRMDDSGVAPHLASTVVFNIKVEPESISASLNTTIKTTFMAVAQIKTVPITVSAATENRAEPVEMVLVLDTTESMGPHMNQLRIAAQELVDILTSRGASRVAKVGLVPFVGAVNIGNGSDREIWIDVDGDGPFNANNLRGLPLVVIPTCAGNFKGNPVIESVSGGSYKEGRLETSPLMKKVSVVFNEFLGINAAQAYEYVEDPCFIRNPENIDNFSLFGDVGGAQWKGCVEARPVPYDVSDTPPNKRDPRTIWVPYFWPDGTDDRPQFVEGVNNYVPDDPFVPNTEMPNDGFGRAYNIKKYDGRRATISERGPYTIGPNKACPDPLVPLTSNYSLLSNRISSLSYFIGSGTNSAEGIAWGMRVLSPGEPFTEGGPYGSVPKVMVLLSDGRNQILRDDGGQPGNFRSGGAFLSHYSSYGTLRFGQFPKLDYENPGNFFDIAESFMDERMAEACKNTKKVGIELYVVALGVTDPHTINGLNRCATSSQHVIRADQGRDLPNAFKFIAQKFSPIRLTK